jgi:hypothetical protein
MNIPTKFGSNRPSGFREEDLKQTIFYWSTCISKSLIINNITMCTINFYIPVSVCIHTPKEYTRQHLTFELFLYWTVVSLTFCWPPLQLNCFCPSFSSLPVYIYKFKSTYRYLMFSYFYIYTVNPASNPE